MYVGVDFDGTVVVQEGRRYDDLRTPLEFMSGAKSALLSLRAAGHVLLLWSARASRALLEDPTLDPLVRAGARRVDLVRWRKSVQVNRARFGQMVDFVNRELPEVFAAIDDGLGGKPQVDLFIDDKVLRLGRGAVSVGWEEIATAYGRSVEKEEPTVVENSAVLLGRRVADLDLAISGRLAQAIAIATSELRGHGISVVPEFTLGDGDFWTSSGSVSVNLPWFLANDALWDLASAKLGYTLASVGKTLRHELGHVACYTYRLHETPRWRELFGDFTAPYRDDFVPDPRVADEHVEYLSNVPRHYGQKHPDEDFAETFATWLDPESGWERAYAAKPVALAKLRYVDTLDWGPPKAVKRGMLRPYRELRGTVRELLGMANHRELR